MGKKFGLENFFKPSGVGDLWVPSVSDFVSEYPLGKSEYVPERTTQDMAVTARFWEEESLLSFEIEGMRAGWVKAAHTKCKQV